MGQRAVLKSAGGKVSLKEMQTFVKTALDHGVPAVEESEVSLDKDGNVMFTIGLPLRVRVVSGKKVVVRQKTKQQRAAAEQIKKHREKIKEEQKEGYVPPVGKKSAPKGKKSKCSVCNVRKPVVTVSGIKVIKPHISKGEPCPGSGKQV